MILPYHGDHSENLYNDVQSPSPLKGHYARKMPHNNAPEPLDSFTV